MPISLSLSDYTRISPEPVSWRRQRGLVRDHTCDLRTEHRMVYHSPDGRTFEVRRLRCEVCGRRHRGATQQEAALALPRLRRGAVAGLVEANF